MINTYASLSPLANFLLSVKQYKDEKIQIEMKESYKDTVSGPQTIKVFKSFSCICKAGLARSFQVLLVLYAIDWFF